MWPVNHYTASIYRKNNYFYVASTVVSGYFLWNRNFLLRPEFFSSVHLKLTSRIEERKLFLLRKIFSTHSPIIYSFCSNTYSYNLVPRVILKCFFRLPIIAQRCTGDEVDINKNLKGFLRPFNKVIDDIFDKTVW